MRRWLAVSLVVGSVLALGCAVDESLNPLPVVPEPLPPESCTAADPSHPEVFPPCDLGRGSFGEWTVDELGLPAYDYLLDQNADDRAAWFNTEGLDRRDHWAAFGNSRLNAMFVNDGYVVLATQDRGPTLLNAFDPDAKNFSGGFGFLDDGEETWCTAYKWRPEGATTTRRFGVGYASSSLEHRGVKVTRRLLAPPGDDPIVIAEVTLENTTDQPKSLRHYEYWDVARRPIEINWLVSGIPFDVAPGGARDARDARNAMFDERATWDGGARVLALRREYVGSDPLPPSTEPNPVDYYPGDPFLAALIGDVDDVFADQAAFFGDGDPGAPAAVVGRAAGHGIGSGTVFGARSGDGQAGAFVLATPVALAPRERVTLRFAYGYAPMGEPIVALAGYADPDRDLDGEVKAAALPNLPLFVTERDPVLHRELAWHQAQIEASVGRRDYWDVHVVPQGSAYLYLHGADGVSRDLSIFTVPLVYTHPELARDELLLNMMVTHADDRRLTYAFQGHGVLDDALGLHEDPSDVTIFLLWAASEYVGATGDEAFLDAPVPYWPIEAEPDATAWDHVVSAIRYLFDHVGTGPHGLVRIQTGDWSDGIVLEAPDQALAIADGESIPNTQMAVAILPRVADLVEPRDPALAAEIRGRVDDYRAALAPTWTGRFFGRAYFGDDTLAYSDTINLEAQVWALIGGSFADEADRVNLVDAVGTELDDPSPLGATLLPSGQVWPAISGLLTWGYAMSDPELAFAHLVRNTMQAHARAYPDIWYGIWSGPDGVDGPAGERPGEAWYSQVTPMTDFPVQNTNQHAMPILATLRVAGVDATATGLRIEPRSPVDFTLRTALVDVTRTGASFFGSYRPTAAGTRTLDVVAPVGSVITRFTVAGAPIAVDGSSRYATATVYTATPSAATAFEVTTAPAE